MTEPLPPSDAGGTDESPERASVPIAARRQSLFERPLFWLALVVGGVALAVGLSYLAEKTDLSGTAGDVGHYCQQVAVIKRANITSLGASALDDSGEAKRLVDELTVLEHVAPRNVADEVREIRQSAQDALVAIRSANQSDPSSAASLFVVLQRAESRSEDAIAQMTEYTQEACGVDLTPTSTASTATSSPSTTVAPVKAAAPATSTTIR